VIETPPYKRTAKQHDLDQLLISDAEEIMAYGGSRSGKTFHFVRAIIIRAMKCESRHCILRKVFNDVKQSVWLDTIPKVMKICFPDMWKMKDQLMNKSDFYLKIPTQHGGESEFWIGGLDDAERVEKILGKEYSTMYFNECSQISLDSIDTATTRLAQKTELVNKFYYDMNPPSKKHWSYFKFILGQDPITKLPIDTRMLAHILMNPEDNVENLSESYMRILDRLPESKKKRFMRGEFADDVVGDVFSTKMIKRIAKLPSDIERMIVAHDPAVTSKITSDEHGLIVCARCGDIGYVIRDNSGIYTPKVAAQKAINLFHEYECDRIIGEVNNGGDYIETVYRDIDKNISYRAVRASRGKVKRAEPVASLYEQGRIYHVGDVGDFQDLETEMGDFKTDEKEMTYSPNRVDALVWGFTDLFDLYKGDPIVEML